MRTEDRRVRQFDPGIFFLISNANEIQLAALGMDACREKTPVAIRKCHNNKKSASVPSIL